MTEPDFPVQEYEMRLAHVQKAMHYDGLDALLFTTEAEMRYFTGFRTLFWQSPTRPWFLVIPKKGKPIAIIPQIGAALMRNSWIDDIRCWASPHESDDGISLLVDLLQGAEKIGMMMGRESSLRMPLADFQKLRDRLRSSSFEDATKLIQHLRMVKSAAEVEKIAAICAIASSSFENAEKLFFEGQPLRDAFRAFKIDLLLRGADDVPYLVGGAGQGGYEDVISPPGKDPLKAGDVLMLDTGATFEGYFCDFDRNFAFGHATDEVKRAYATLYKATDAALQAARPGVSCRDLYMIMQNIIAQQGSDVGRFGHGLGMQLTEPPSFIFFDETRLEAGMVMTLEPSIQMANGKIMVHEENILICEGPPDLLSRRAAPEPPIL